MNSTRLASESEIVLTVQRGMHVLRAFRSDTKSLSNTELVRNTGLSKATISRLTSTFVELGFLRRSPGGRQFELSTGPLSIGNSYVETSPLLRHAHPFMQELANRLNVSVALAAPEQLDMLYVAYRISRKIATLRLGIGSIFSMGDTAIGRAYLWGLDPHERVKTISALKNAAGDDGLALERSINASFDELRQGGTCFVLSDSGYRRDAFGVALPVRVGLQRSLMGLSCAAVEVGPRLETTRKRVAHALKNAAPQFEEAMAQVDCDA